MNTNLNKFATNGCREMSQCCSSIAPSKAIPNEIELVPYMKNRIYENTMCNGIAAAGPGVACSSINDMNHKKDSSRAACGCYFSSGSCSIWQPMATYANDKQQATLSRIQKAVSSPCETKCHCCNIRPRSSTISGENIYSAYNNPYRNMNAAMTNSTSRVNDFNKAKARCNGAPGKPCSCKAGKGSKSGKSQYSRVKDLTYRKPLTVAKRECQCSACKAAFNSAKEPSNRKVCLDGRVGLCNCALTQDVSKTMQSLGKTSRVGTSVSTSRSGSSNGFKKKHAAMDSVDSVDGADSSLRKAAIAENILEYEISALEYGISVVEGSRDVMDYGRGLYVKELKEAEPKYQNVRQFVVEEKPQYANLEEMTRMYGDRLGPEGQNLEDEVYYENLTSVRHSIRGIRDQNAATTRILSASANNLCFYNDVNFYSGTFPQYLQKEMRGHPLPLSRSHSDKGAVYAMDEECSNPTVMEIVRKLPLQ